MQQGTIGDTTIFDSTVIDPKFDPQQAYATAQEVDNKEEIKQTICMGWLLYLAEEFDSAALSKEIWYLTGVLVTLVYWEIDGSFPFQASSSNPQPMALHLEINRQSSDIDMKHIATLHSMASNTFPLGIKMHLVPEYQALTNRHAKEMF